MASTAAPPPTSKRWLPVNTLPVRGPRLWGPLQQIAIRQQTSRAAKTHCLQSYDSVHIGTAKWLRSTYMFFFFQDLFITATG